MELNRRARRHLRFQAASFAVLFLAVAGLLGWLSTRYHFQSDWTATGRHTLSKESRAVVDRLHGPVTITAFARDSKLLATRAKIRNLLERYQRAKGNLTLTFVDPDLAPEQVRHFGVRVNGELVVQYGGRHENVRRLDEESLTDALQRLARSGERRIEFLTGHGERSPDGADGGALSNWVRQLKPQGFTVEALNLAQKRAIPAGTTVLVIAEPQKPFLPGEVKLIRDWVAGGGDLLWLAGPGSDASLKPLADGFGVQFKPGVVVDPTTQVLGIGEPDFAVVADYPFHTITRGLRSVSLFPRSAALGVTPGGAWESRPLFKTVQNTWTETGPISGTIKYDGGDETAGPLTLGVALTRQPEKSGKGDKGKGREQRVVVVGDTDFLANRYLGNGVNLELGNRIVNWLAHDDALITIPPKVAPDKRLKMTPTLSAVIGFGFLLVIPLGLAGAGVIIWLRRRKR